MASEALKKRCLESAEAARSALDWMLDPENAETVGSERKVLAKEVRRDERRARQLAEAVDRPMSIGVYGPSQAGKSYLVSVLAKPQEGRLVAAVGDGMDFIEEINPEGDKEATGLVTRFTMRPQACPPGYPVVLKILSEADIVRILANSFFRDGDNSEPAPKKQDLAQRLTEARGRMGTGSGLSEADIWDIQSYFETHFRGIGYAQELASFWEDAAEIVPQLDVPAKRALLSVLWGDYEAFSELYETLAGALAQLGHPEVVYAGVESLTPRTTSIIDVATLGGLDGLGDGGPVRLRSDAGRETELARPVATALTAELVLPMQTKPWDLFDEADLLDFPGVRERRTAKGPLDNFFRQSEAPRKELFLRGKVGFLFERYVAQQDLTAMLLCIPPSNVNVAADLSQGVEEWIARTQGGSPQERDEVETLLFLVLTMFDRHLADPAGSLDPYQRFENRVEASLIAPFGGLKDSWPLTWKPGKPFSNSYWLRNPNYPAEHVIDYEAGREIRLRDGKIERLGELKQGCLASDLVNRHFRDPEAAWEAAMSLNDGGVRYLVEAMTPVATVAVKERQIEARLRELCARMANRLKPFYSDSDVETRLGARRAAAMRTIKELQTAFENRRFGRVLEEFTIEPQSIAWRMDRIPENVQIVSTEAGSGDDFGDWLPDMDDHMADLAPAPDDTAPEIETRVVSMTREAYQAEAALEAWRERLRALSERPDLSSVLNVSPVSIAEVSTELATAARRLKLAERIERELKTWNDLQSSPVTIAALAAHRINQIVMTLGVDFMEPDARPVLTNRRTNVSRPVFELVPDRSDAMDLPETPVRRDRLFFQDWTYVLFKIFENNALSDDGSMINVEQNAKLGSVLERLQNAETGGVS